MKGTAPSQTGVTSPWRIDGQSATEIAVDGVGSLEVQAVCPADKGLWLGLPNGVATIPWKSLEPVPADRS